MQRNNEYKKSLWRNVYRFLPDITVFFLFRCNINTTLVNMNKSRAVKLMLQCKCPLLPDDSMKHFVRGYGNQEGTIYNGTASCGARRCTIIQEEV